MAKKILKDISLKKEKNHRLKKEKETDERAIKINQEKPSLEEEGISWSAPEYEKLPKPRYWYAINVFIVLILLIFALWSKNFFFALFIVLVEMVLIISGRRGPQNFHFLLNEKGLKIDNQFFGYEKFEGYLLREGLGGVRKYDELILKKKNVINPYLKILFDRNLKEELKSILAVKLPEIQYEDSLIDIFFEWLRF